MLMGVEMRSVKGTKFFTHITPMPHFTFWRTESQKTLGLLKVRDFFVCSEQNSQCHDNEIVLRNHEAKVTLFSPWFWALCRSTGCFA